MSRTCTVCRSKHRQEIEAALLAMEPYRHIAARMDLAPSSLVRHRRAHLPPQLAKAAELEEAHEAADLLAEVRAIHARTLGLIERAEKGEEWAEVRLLLRELRANVDLLARVRGVMAQAPVGGTVINALSITYVRDWRDGAVEAEAVVEKALPANGDGGGNGGGSQPHSTRKDRT